MQRQDSRDAPREEVDRAAAASPAPAADSAMAEKKSQLGTGYGRSETSYAQYIDFQRASDTPTETIAISTYRYSFRNYDMGLGSAVSYIIFAVVFLFGIYFVRRMNRTRVD